MPNLALEYNSLGEVISEVKAVLTVDLAKYTMRLPNSYAGCLVKDPVGIYARGSLEPILDFTRYPEEPEREAFYYSNTQYLTDIGTPDIIDFESFVSCKERVIQLKNQNATVVCVNPKALASIVQQTCSFNYAAVQLALCEAWEILKGLHRDTRPNTKIKPWVLDQMTWVKPNYRTSFDSACQPGLAYLTDRIYEFVGDDIFSLYSLHLNNTTLHVEKGNDFRIVEYYRTIFQQYEEQRFLEHGF